MLKKLSLVLLIFLSLKIQVASAKKSQKLFLIKAVDPLGNDISGDRQLGVVNNTLNNPFLVSVRDEENNPIKDIAVAFKVLNDENARCIPTVVYTDENGYAKTMVTPGNRTGEFIFEAKLIDDPSERLIFTYNIFNRRWMYLLIIQVIGGFALFFFGFRVAGKGLTKSAGGYLRELLYRFTKNRFLGLISGIIITFLLQSSTAASVMLVSFITAGLILFINALFVALGTAIGTTLTVQLIAFKIYNYSLLIIGIGFLLNNFKKPVRYYGQFILGFGFIFLGIKIMGEAFLPLNMSGSLEQFFVMFKEHPSLVFLISTIFTALVHSSAATIGVVISLSFQGIIGLEHALPVILGANLGTSTTALIASIRGSRDAKMYALGNFFFKLITVLIFLPLVGFWSSLFQKTASTVARQIANSHTFFNLILVVIFLPIIGPVGKLLNKVVPKERKELRKGPRFLDKSIIDNPAAAIAHANREILRMADMVLDMFSRSMEVFKHNDKDLMRDLIKEDDEVDNLEEEINDYLTSISQEELTDYQSKRVTSLFFVTDELEHIGDIVSKSLMVYAGKKIKQGFIFSDEGFSEIIAFHRRIKENFDSAIGAITTYDKSLAGGLMDERKVGVDTHIKLHNAHIDRLKRGLSETIETSTIHLDFIDDLERVNFHISNIGYAILGKVGLKP
ncbi:Na/Pi symporter [candidate division WOR-3 bacterium]|nr:Na/Pi symporter [candidate division WOR-3 bacterium]